MNASLARLERQAIPGTCKKSTRERRIRARAPLKPVNPRKGVTKMNRLMMASMTSLLLTSGLALAHGGGRGLARFDRDGNGSVTRDEMRTTAIEHFDKTDANK